MENLLLKCRFERESLMMFAKVESQSNGIDLIKIDNEETKLFLQIMVRELYRGNTTIIILYWVMSLKQMSFMNRILIILVQP